MLNDIEKLMELAEDGDLEAQKSLGLLFELGLSVPSNPEKAFKWWKMAAENGDPWATYTVSKFYENGTGVDKDHEKAQEWLKKAEESGSLAAKIEQHGSYDLGLGASGDKILIVEDEKDIRSILENIVVKEGYQAIMAEGGSVALNHVANNPDIVAILVDLNMPDMNGLQFVKTLRRLKVLEGVPVIVVTGHSKPEYVKIGRSLAVSGWITKPFKREQIVATLSRVLES